MIYLKSDGSKDCDKIIEAFYKEMADINTSVFNTGEPVERVRDTQFKLDKQEGTKVIDFSFMHQLLSNKVSDINRIDYIQWLEPTVDSILKTSREIEYCILLPDIEQNEPATLRSKVVNDMKVKFHGKCKITRVPSFYNSHKSNPYQIVLNDHQVNLLSLEKELTTHMMRA